MIKKKKVLLLSIDGGGVRGKIATGILSLLEQDLKQPTYTTFDFFAGTSTGALIVLGITANKYTATELNDLCTTENLQKVFAKDLWNYIPYIGSKYCGVGKRTFLNHLFANKQYSTITKPTVIPAYDFKNKASVIFKNIGCKGDFYNPLIAEVADATTAAPSYFPTVVTQESVPRNLIDGGIVANNPSLCLLSEAIASGVDIKNIKLLSIGTGYKYLATHSNISQDWSDLTWIKNGLIDDFMLGNTSVIEYQCKTLLNNNYLRINGTLGEVDEAFDNISATNLQQINNLALTWYKNYKYEILNFVAQ